MISVSSIVAPRRAVDWFSTAQVAERAADGPFLPADRVSLSAEARGALERVDGAAEPGERGSRPDTSGQPGARAAAAGADVGQAPGRGGAGAGAPLTPEQQRQVRDLQARDVHVRAHEAAHQAAGGDLTGPASFSYELGPDGRSYAVGGEVPIQSRSGRTPEETIAIARRVRAAALAPADPSPADLAAAAAASQVELRAMQQKRQLGQGGGAAAASGAGRGAGAPGARPGVPSGGTAGAGPAAPISTPQADLERLIVRAPEAELPF